MKIIFIDHLCKNHLETDKQFGVCFFFISFLSFLLFCLFFIFILKTGERSQSCKYIKVQQDNIFLYRDNASPWPLPSYAKGI